MNQNDSTPDRPPTPEQIAAWVDGETSPGEAAAVESWMADHPDARREAESMAQMTRMYRDQVLPTPSERCWQLALDRIGPRVAPTARPWRVLLGLALASAALWAAVVIGRAFWPTPTPIPAPLAQTPIPPGEDDDDEPFAVARMSEVHIIRMDAEDADRIVTGQPLIGTMVFAGKGDIKVEKVQADADGGNTPHLERGADLPWVGLDRAEGENQP